MWVAGFDLFYSLYDVDHDRAEGLHSWAVRFGERGVFVERGCSTPAPSCFSPRLVSGSTSRRSTGSGSSSRPHSSSTSTGSFGPATWDGCDAAFFTMNGLISVVFFVFVALDVLVA